MAYSELFEKCLSLIERNFEFLITEYHFKIIDISPAYSTAKITYFNEKSSIKLEVMYGVVDWMIYINIYDKAKRKDLLDIGESLFSDFKYKDYIIVDYNKDLNIIYKTLDDKLNNCASLLKMYLEKNTII